MLSTTRWRSQPTTGGKSSASVFFPRPESQLLVETRSNLMLAGAQSALEQAIVALKPKLRLPVWTWGEGDTFYMPAETINTLVLREVGRLDRDQQQCLVRWLDIADGGLQVISTTSEPLFALVERRAFLDVLYYRLNVVRIDLTNDRAIASGADVS